MDSQIVELDIYIGRDGKATIGVNGAKGTQCKDITKAYEAALGNVTSDTPTAEMFTEVPSAARQHAVKRD